MELISISRLRRIIRTLITPKIIIIRLGLAILIGFSIIIKTYIKTIVYMVRLRWLSISWTGLKAVGRLGGDFTNSRQTRWNEKVILTPGSWSAIWGKTPQVGTYRERTDNLGQIDATAFLSADYKIGEDIALSGIAGWNLNQRTSSYLDSYLYGLQQVGWFSLDNGADKPQTKSYRKARRLVACSRKRNSGIRISGS